MTTLWDPLNYNITLRLTCSRCNYTSCTGKNSRVTTIKCQLLEDITFRDGHLLAVTWLESWLRTEESRRKFLTTTATDSRRYKPLNSILKNNPTSLTAANRQTRIPIVRFAQSPSITRSSSLPTLNKERLLPKGLTIPDM